MFCKSIEFYKTSALVFRVCIFGIYLFAVNYHRVGIICFIGSLVRVGTNLKYWFGTGLKGFKVGYRFL